MLCQPSASRFGLDLIHWHAERCWSFQPATRGGAWASSAGESSIYTKPHTASCRVHEVKTSHLIVKVRPYLQPVVPQWLVHFIITYEYFHHNAFETNTLLVVMTPTSLPKIHPHRKCLLDSFGFWIRNIATSLRRIVSERSGFYTHLLNYPWEASRQVRVG